MWKIYWDRRDVMTPRSVNGFPQISVYYKDATRQTIVSDFQKHMLYFPIVCLNLKKQKTINEHERSLAA